MMTKMAIITGASRGIGKACAEMFLQNQWQVLNLSRHACDLAGVVNVTVDFANPNWADEIQTSLAKQIAKACKLCLVHNAAYHPNDSVDDLDPTDLSQTLQVNIVSAAQLNQLVLPSMKLGSAIIYIGSTLSEKAVAGAASYVISKHATVGLMRATCQDLSGRGIHTCCVCPGFTDTAMLRQHVGHDEMVLAQIKAKVSAKRLLEPQEIARVVYFCAENPAIDGAVLHANLGQIES